MALYAYQSLSHLDILKKIGIDAEGHPRFTAISSHASFFQGGGGGGGGRSNAMAIGVISSSAVKKPKDFKIANVKTMRLSPSNGIRIAWISRRI